jgi:hypothetical protein
MAKLINYKTITINRNNYAVCKIAFKSTYVPIIVDSKFIDKIISLNKDWKINYNGLVSTTHSITLDDGNKEIFEVYLHDVVLKLNGTHKNKCVLHINRLGIDNRVANLMFDECNKAIKKNSRKKSRTIILPKKNKINPEDIPSFVWYMKPDTTHGERFLVDIGDISWKTPSSRTLSLRYKLEEAKKFLRKLKEIEHA